MASIMTPSNRRHTSYGLHASCVEKWDVVLWNDQVNLSHQESTGTYAHHHGQPASPVSQPRIAQEKGTFATGSPHSSPPTRPYFAASASAFGFGSAPSPRPIAPKSPHNSAVEPLQVRHEALSALHRSVQQHDADFLARMRELEQRCHLLPDSLSVLRSEDLSCPTRGRKRDIASWDDDGDVEMTCWSERRRKHLSPWGASSGLFGSETPACDLDKTSHSSDDEYVVATHEADTDSHSSSGEEDDDDLDIVIVTGGSTASSPPSFSTSLSSLPTRADSHSHAMHPYTPLSPIPSTKKDIDELTAAMAGGAGSVVPWSASSDISGDESHRINPDIAQAGALWA